MNSITSFKVGAEQPPHLADKISSFARKLDMQGKRLERGNTDCFEILSDFIETSNLDATPVIPCVKERISSLIEFFSKILPRQQGSV